MRGDRGGRRDDLTEGRNEWDTRVCARPTRIATERSQLHIARKRVLLAGTLATALCLVGGVAFATIPDRGDVIHACYAASTGSLRVVDTAKGARCAAGEKKLRWNVKGRLGLQGPQGAQGSQGATGSQGAQGPPGLSAYEQVHRQILVNAGADANVSASCPAGKKVIGGGFDIETPTDVKVYSSEPTDGAGNFSDTIWVAFVHNAGSVTRQVTVTAICATVASG
jgi:hypothetical protein